MQRGHTVKRSLVSLKQEEVVRQRQFLWQKSLCSKRTQDCAISVEVFVLT